MGQCLTLNRSQLKMIAGLDTGTVQLGEAVHYLLALPCWASITA
jgi:hypothetical protein